MSGGFQSRSYIRDRARIRVHNLSTRGSRVSAPSRLLCHRWFPSVLRLPTTCHIAVSPLKGSSYPIHKMTTRKISYGIKMDPKSTTPSVASTQNSMVKTFQSSRKSFTNSIASSISSIAGSIASSVMTIASIFTFPASYISMALSATSDGKKKRKVKLRVKYPKWMKFVDWFVSEHA